MNKKVPKVSIIVPIFNVEKYLRKNLDSIVNQTLKDIEIILVNDGSTDSSINIMNDYQRNDSRIIIINKKNSGYGHSMNIGLSKATGEYIGIIEPDDWIELNMFETLYGKAKEHNTDVVKSDFYYYWSKNNVNIKANIFSEFDLNRIINQKSAKKYSIFSLMPCIWTAIYKNEFIKRNNIDFLETPGASYQDTSFSFKVWALSDKIILINEAFVHYCQDNEQSSVNNKNKVFCVCDEWEEIENFIQQQQMNMFLMKMAQRIKYATYMWNIQRLSYPLNYQFLQKMSEEYRQSNNKKLLDQEFWSKKEYKKIQKIIKNPDIFLKKLINS